MKIACQNGATLQHCYTATFGFLYFRNFHAALSFYIIYYYNNI